MKTEQERLFIEVYHSHKDKIYRLCMGFVREKALADDLFQEILIKIWSHIGSFRRQSEISTWVYRIAYNTAITFSAKEKKNMNRHAPACTMDIPDQESSGPEQERQLQKLYEAIGDLHETERVIATLLLENTPYKIIAEITGISENYVAVKVNRIKSSLTQKLNPNGK